MAARSMLFALALWLALVDFFSNFANANLTVRPTDTVVLVNQTTYFNCSTSTRNIDAEFVLWYHYPVNSPTRKDVYDEGNIMHEYKDRFRMETDLAEGVFNLVAGRPNLADAGKYECQDGVGQGVKASAELIVLDGNPSCESNMTSDGVIGPNDCGLELDVIQLTCNVASYHGNIPPTLEWTMSGSKSSSSLVVCNRSTSCNLTLKGNLDLNSRSLVCQTMKARDQQYGCSAGPVKVKYALSSSVNRVKLTTEDDAKCYANSSQSCSYKWYNDKNETVSPDANLWKQDPGRYKCEAQCKMNQQLASCKFIAMKVEVVSQELSVAEWLASIMVPIVSCLALFIGGCICHNKCQERKAAKKSARKDNEEPLMLKSTNDVQGDGQEESSERLSSLPAISGTDTVDTLTVNKYFMDRGTSGAIYGPFRWKDKKCALKQILYSPDKVTAERKDEITQLRDRSRDLNHPHLVKVFDVWFPAPALYVLLEYAEGKSLDKILRPKDATAPLEPFPPDIVNDWALQIADGMKYLHEKKLVHRNLKAAHVLVMESPDVSPKTLKIGSYTLTREHDNSTVMSLKGTMAWMAPEYIRGEKFSMFSDVWSYGVTVWEILTRDVPYKEIRKETDLVRAAINKTLELKIPEYCPERLQAVLTNCLNYDVEDRPSFKKICNHLIATDYLEESRLQ